MRLADRSREGATRPVLIIDDDPDAIILAKRALSSAGTTSPFVALSDGREAIAHLKQCIQGNAPMPLFVFLDLKMPGIDGFDVLDWIGHQPELRHLIIIVLSTSSAPRDVTRAFELGADAYLPKFPPVSEIKTVFQLANAMLSIEDLERQLWPGLRPPKPARSPA